MKGFKGFLSVLLSLCMIFSMTGLSAFADEFDDIEEFPATVDDIEEAEENTENITGDIVENENAESEENNENDGSTSENNTSAEQLDVAAGHANEDQKEVTVPARSIKIKGAQKVTLVIGNTHKIDYKLYPVKSDDYVTFRSMNTNVIRVDREGLVTAVGYGTAKVQVSTSKGKKQNMYFTVTDESGNDDPEITYEEISAIELADQMAMIRVGKQIQIDPILYPLGSQDTLTYTSQNSSIAKVSSNGVVTGVGTGSTIITVTASSGVYAQFSVTVYDDVLRGIDVSKWQGDIDWKKVSMSGIDFAMIRSSFGNMHTDEKLAANVAGCEKYGIPYGFYHYSYADSVKEAKKEARYFLSVIKKYSPEYPIVLDIENDHFKSMSRKQVTNIILAFVKEIENAGYYVSIYSFAKFFNDYVDMSKIQNYDIWIACWGDEERLNSFYDGPYGMWQYSATGSVKGIDGEVDLDYAYKDYADRIRKAGLNNL